MVIERIKTRLKDIDKRQWLVLAIFLAVLAISLPSLIRTHNKLHPTITLAYANHPAMALVFVAEEQGFFRQENLTVNYHSFFAGRDALNEVLEGKADLATVYETPFVRRVYEGSKISAISTLHTSSANTQIIARKDRGVNAVQDLKGKKIGVAKDTSGEYYLYSFLLNEGLKLSDVTIVDVPADKFEETFDSGFIDALAIWNPSLIELQKKYQDRVVTFNSDIYTEFSLLIGQDDYIASNTPAVLAMLRALAKAKDFADQNQEQAKADVAKFLHSQNPDEVYDSWKYFTPTLKLNHLLLNSLQLEAQWFKDNGVYRDEVPDYRSRIHDAPLRQIEPEAVTLF